MQVLAVSMLCSVMVEQRSIKNKKKNYQNNSLKLILLYYLVQVLYVTIQNLNIDGVQNSLLDEILVNLSNIKPEKKK